MRIAIVGTGISGLVCGHVLHDQHDLTLFEAGSHIGGHTNTVPVASVGRSWNVDTGFIVYNELNYPNFSRIIDQLGVETQASEMSFSVRNEASGLEWCGTNLDTVFAQRRNLLRPAFYGMLRDIFRFNRAAKDFLVSDQASTPTVGDFLQRLKLGRAFTEDYLVPMASAIWSMPSRAIADFPFRSMAHFLANHRMLQIGDRPQWRTIRGGSWNYVRAMTAPFRDRIHTNCPVEAIHRTAAGVRLRAGGEERSFDAVIVASHSDQALRLLDDASEAERTILGAIGYQANRAVLHTDTRRLPRSRRAWAAWNAHVGVDDSIACVTYHSNILQRLQAPETWLVTLGNHDGIDEERVLRRIDYAHPFYDRAAVGAQARHAEISGQRHTYYAGAYWGHGFHEDGVVSGLRVCEQLGARLAPGLDSSLGDRLATARTDPGVAA